MAIESAKTVKDSISKGSITNILFGIVSFFLVYYLNTINTKLEEIQKNQNEYMSNMKIIQYRLDFLEKQNGIKTETKPTSFLLYKHEPIYEIPKPL